MQINLLFYFCAVDSIGLVTTAEIQKDSPSYDIFWVTHSATPPRTMSGNSKMVLVLILQLENLKKVIMWFYNQSIFFSI